MEMENQNQNGTRCALCCLCCFSCCFFLFIFIFIPLFFMYFTYWWVEMLLTLFVWSPPPVGRPMQCKFVDTNSSCCLLLQHIPAPQMCPIYSPYISPYFHILTYIYVNIYNAVAAAHRRSPCQSFAPENQSLDSRKNDSWYRIISVSFVISSFLLIFTSTQRKRGREKAESRKRGKSQGWTVAITIYLGFYNFCALPASCCLTFLASLGLLHLLLLITAVTDTELETHTQRQRETVTDTFTARDKAIQILAGT